MHVLGLPTHGIQDIKEGSRKTLLRIRGLKGVLKSLQDSKYIGANRGVKDVERRVEDGGISACPASTVILLDRRNDVLCRNRAPHKMTGVNRELRGNVAKLK